MSETDAASLPELSVILPANNEEARLGACLDAVCASRWTRARPVEVIVVANGCTDKTATVARAKRFRFEERQWPLRIVERAEGNKLAALNAGDELARGTVRVYLDADVVVSADVLRQIAETLDTPTARYASGTVNIVLPRNPISRAYRRIWRQVPFMADCVPGCGLFAVNAAGRARWGAFPDIISDDTFVRLQFAPDERVAVPAPYDWPIVEGWANLVKVRRRQNRGVDQISDHYPSLLRNDDKKPMTRQAVLAMALRDPIGFAVYAGVAAAVRLTPGVRSGWSRGR